MTRLLALATIALATSCTFDASGVSAGGDASVDMLVRCDSTGPRLGRLKLTVSSASVFESGTKAALVDLSQIDASHPFWTMVQVDDNNTDEVDVTGGDLIVTDERQQRLPLDVVFVDPTAHRGELWFAGALDAGSDRTFYLYYGARSGAAIQPRADRAFGRDDVWDEGYIAVYHLQENSSTYSSSARHRLGGSGQGGGPTYDAATRFGTGAQFFDANADQYIQIGNQTGWDFTTALTIEAWARFASFDPIGTGNTTIAAKTGAYRLAVGRMGEPIAMINGEELAGPVNSITTNDWHMLAMTYDGSTLRLFHNGAQIAEEVRNVPIMVNTQRFDIGRYTSGGDAHMSGTLDEVRISRVARSADYLRTQFDMGNANGLFVTAGSHEPCM